MIHMKLNIIIANDYISNDPCDNKTLILDGPTKGLTTQVLQMIKNDQAETLRLLEDCGGENAANKISLKVKKPCELN